MRPNILVIEPEPMLRLTMTKFLQSSGYAVTACPDAATGASLLATATTPPALIVLAVRTLDAGTLADAQRIRQAARQVPILGIADVLALSDRPAMPDRLRFLAPPYDMPDVLRAVRSALKQAGVEPSAAP
jgi:DNA-binding response OmpR family regulator